MRALTLCQPWATLVALGLKRIETRSWGTAYRGPLAIHAAKGLGPVGGRRGFRALCATQPFANALSTLRTPTAASMRGLPFGAVVAVAELVDVVSTDRLPPDVAGRLLFSSNERAFGDYSPGRYAWILTDVVALPAPVECAGTLGLWTLPEAVAAALPALPPPA